MSKLQKGGETIRVSPKQGELVIPEGVEEIPDGAFFRNVGIRKVVFPSSLKKIGDKAFAACRDLESVEIPPTVSEVGGAAFAKCASLCSLTCSPTATLFSHNAFAGCENMRVVHWREGDDENTAYCFYVPKNNQFIVTGFLHDSNDVKVYGGKYARREFPSGGPVDGARYLYVAVAEDPEGKEHIYFNTDEKDAIQGAFLSANGRTIKQNFGVLGEETVITPRKLGIICGFCDVGVRNMCAALNRGYDDPVTIGECLETLGRFAPGAFRRLAYVLEHQEDKDNVRDIEHYLSDFESRSAGVTDTETMTWKS